MVWETWHFGFDNGNTDTDTAFELWGSTTIRHVLTGSGTLAGSDVVESNVRGAGVLNGATAVFSGTLSAMNFSSSKNKR
jgi:hypothetical protein